MIPDVFEIIINKEELNKISSGSFRTDHGLTSEKYLFLNDHPVALIYNLEKYHDQFNFDPKQFILLIINQLPKGNMEIKRTSAKTILELLDEALFIYEADCDQYDFKSFNMSDYGLDELLNKDLEPIDTNLKAFTIRK